MKYILSSIFIIMLVACPDTLLAQETVLSGYQDTNGAITNDYAGDTVDPYFATKAMFIIMDTNPAANKQALKWVAWGLQIQSADGLFGRYKRKDKDDWYQYARADADDAILALWLQLLYRLAPTTGMKESWKKSAGLAEIQLSRLYDPVQGIYLISADMPIGLLMDNIEIYYAFTQIAKNQHRLGQEVKATESEQKAALLAKNIARIFKPTRSSEYLISTQQPNENHFYPDKVAQLYPILYALQGSYNSASVYTNWMSANGKEWLAQKDNDYVWGLVAITALSMNDNYSAACWQNRTEPMRYSRHWNVLEEATRQYVTWKLQMRHYNNIACVGGNLS